MRKNIFYRCGAAALGLAMALAAPGIASAAGQEKTLTGEVVDLMCYLDHGAKGEKHQGCAEKCIQSGGPVGLLSGDDLYLVVGEHKPMNDQLAPEAGKTIRLKGKVVEKHGMKMIENAEIVK